MRCNWLRKLANSLLALSSAVAISGCYSMNGYVMNRSGQGYYEQGNFQAAATEFQHAMLSEPGNPDYVANLARTRYRMGDAAGAEQLYRQSLAIAPSHQPSYHGLSEVLIAQGRSPEAGALLQTWASTQPYVAESHVELAWLQTEMGQPDAAVQSLQNALQVNPNHSTALAQLGQIYHDSGQPEQAIAMYQQSLRTDWNQPDVQSRLAAAAQSAGQSHPLGATAMARGMHPYQMAQQQYAFGPPSPGAQYAQNQIQQQFAMNGYPQPQLAMRPPMYNEAGFASQGEFASQWQTVPSSPVEQPWTVSPGGAQMAQAGFGGVPMTAPVTSQSAMAAPSTAPGDVVFGEFFDVSASPDAGLPPAPVSSPSQSPYGMPMPTPDPAFQPTEMPLAPALTVSSSQSLEIPAAGNDATPVVEAF